MPRGGWRPNSGRKPKARLPFARKAQAESVLGKFGGEWQGKKLPSEDELWVTLLLAQDARIRLDTLKYLTDRRDGKPQQHIDVDIGPDPLIELIGEFRKQYKSCD